MLVVVEDWDIERLPQLFLNLETLRRLDVLQVDAAEGRLQHLASLYDFFRILRIQLDVEDIDLGKPLEQDRLTFHDRLARKRPDVSESQDCGSVANHSHEIALVRVLISERRVLFDREAGERDSGRIGEAEVSGGEAGFGRGDLGFAGTALNVIIERILLAYGHSRNSSVT